MEERWYACYTRSRHEKRVHDVLVRQGIESFLPLVREERRWKDRRKMVELPLFPSYVFVRTGLDGLHRVTSVPGVAHVVRSEGRPVPIGDAEVENVRRLALILRDEPVDLDITSFVGPGDEVDVVAGPFAGLRGRVVQVRGRRRLLIGVLAIDRALELNVDSRVLRPVA